MKNFENYNSNNINIGDYVICSDKFFNTQINYVNYDLEKYHNFLNNNIGKIVDKEKDDNRFIVKYNNIPVTIKTFFQKYNTTVFNEY